MGRHGKLICCLDIKHCSAKGSEMGHLHLQIMTSVILCDTHPNLSSISVVILGRLFLYLNILNIYKHM